MYKTAIFRDRRDAGAKLAESLEKYRSDKPIILGMPRGGVVVAYEIAKVLNAQLDVIVARKLGAPSQPEFAIGAIAPGDIVVFNEEVQGYYAPDSAEIKKIISEEKLEMQRRINLYRQGRSNLEVKNKVVIIVDDGVATGQSAIAAVRSVRKMQPQKIVFAAGVGALDAIKVLEREADEVICLAMPANFMAVGQWYENFDQTTDDEVIALMQLSEKNK